jgi:hypothetical protein
VNHNRPLQGYKHKSRRKPISPQAQISQNLEVEQEQHKPRKTAQIARGIAILDTTTVSGADLFASLRYETCSTYIEVSLQRRQHRVTEVLEGSTPPGKVGQLGCCSRRVAPLNMVGHLGVLPAATCRSSLDATTNTFRAVTQGLVHAQASSFVFVHVRRTRCPSTRNCLKVG